MNLVIAIIGIFVAFFILAYIDYGIAIDKSNFLDVILKYWWAFPTMLTTAPFIWFGYREIYSLSGEQVWLTSMINSILVYISFIAGVYWASGVIPTKYQVIALILNFIAILIASIKG